MRSVLYEFKCDYQSEGRSFCCSVLSRFARFVLDDLIVLMVLFLIVSTRLEWIDGLICGVIDSGSFLQFSIGLHRHLTFL